MKCETLVYHPNIDLEGNVCLNILREDWKPVLTINSIVYGLQYLFAVRRSSLQNSMLAQLVANSYKIETSMHFMHIYISGAESRRSIEQRGS